MTVAPVVSDLLGGGVVLLQKFRAAKVVRFFGSALVSLKNEDVPCYEHERP
jgi:hypothetical protein